MINDEEEFLNNLLKRIERLEAKSNKSVTHRMDYLTWCLANPVSLIFIPVLISIGIEIALNNWGSVYSEWTLESLTKSANWTIPLLVFTVGLIVSFGNKLYLLIQERGDMNLLAELRADTNGLRRDFELKEAKRDAERKEAEAKRDAERKEAEAKRDAERKVAEAKRDAERKVAEAKRDAERKEAKRDAERKEAKRDAEFNALLDRFDSLKNRVLIVETKLANLETKE